MKLVEVIHVPVRYKGVTHPCAAQFEMEDADVNEKLVKIIGDVSPSEKLLEEMSVNELKAYAVARGIDIGKASTEEGISKKIEEAQKAE